ncbi:MAG: RNA polymerase sigma factor [Polyangiales bacterium]
MKAYVAGDEAAFRVLFDRHCPRLIGLTRRYVRDETLAQELVQQAFFQLHVARHDFRLDSRLKPWLYTITMNLVRQHYRRQGRRKESPLIEERLGEESSASVGLERRERAAQVRAALRQLPDKQREVIELHWLEERSFAEVAAIVGAKEGAVRVRAHRAYTALRRSLAGETAPTGAEDTRVGSKLRIKEG